MSRNITLHIDTEETKRFYDLQSGFSCNCKDCQDYINLISEVERCMSPLNDLLGIDFSKDVGKGMDELMVVDSKGQRLFVVPYYVIGTCLVEDKQLQKQLPGPIWAQTKRAEYTINENISICIINTSNAIEMKDPSHVLTLWLEYKIEV